MERIKNTLAKCIPLKFNLLSKSRSSDNITSGDSVFGRIKKYLFKNEIDDDKEIEYIDAESDDSDGFVVVTHSEIFCFKRRFENFRRSR